jgi:hypothetical protein
MRRLIVLVVLTAVVVAFGMANGHHVPVSFVIGQPVPVRQIFLLLSAAALGSIGTLVAQQYLRIMRRRAREELRWVLRSHKGDLEQEEPRRTVRTVELSERPRQAGRGLDRRAETGALLDRGRRSSAPPRKADVALAHNAAKRSRPRTNREDLDEAEE